MSFFYVHRLNQGSLWCLGNLLGIGIQVGVQNLKCSQSFLGSAVV